MLKNWRINEQYGVQDILFPSPPPSSSKTSLKDVLKTILVYKNIFVIEVGIEKIPYFSLRRKYE